MIPAQERRMVPVGGSVIAMTSTDEARQAAAWEFMKFVVSPESNARIVQATGYLPTSEAALETETLQAYFEEFPERAIALEQLQYARPQASVISLAMGTEILRQAVEKLLVANVPSEEVMAEAKEALITEYEENFR
ncbi:MAG: extracellular solute-binding protein [Anaerolineae bacterium]|nr:extracellular solute-binding protein [Anaerolineae bacterium]